jgi:hypothetical protein
MERHRYDSGADYRPFAGISQGPLKNLIKRVHPAHPLRAKSNAPCAFASIASCVSMNKYKTDEKFSHLW